MMTRKQAHQTTSLLAGKISPLKGSVEKKSAGEDWMRPCKAGVEIASDEIMIIWNGSACGSARLTLSPEDWEFINPG